LGRSSEAQKGKSRGRKYPEKVVVEKKGKGKKKKRGAAPDSGDEKIEIPNAGTKVKTGVIRDWGQERK